MRVRYVNRDDRDHIRLDILGCHDMKRASALIAHYQTARLRHFGRIIFEHIPCTQCPAHLADGNFTFKHSLDSMGTKQEDGDCHD